MDPQRFPGLAPGLAQLERESLSFHGVRQAPFTGWTVAGQTASQCGFPALFGDQPMGRRVCLGNVFRAQGYRLSYLNGSSLAFADKGTFWAANGYERRLGTQGVVALAGRPDAPLSAWGAYDDDLLDAGLAEYRRLRRSGEPFVLTLLTVDTHPPHGLPTPACRGLPGYGDGRSSTLTAVRCADRLLSAFVRQIEAEAGQDTLIVVSSDHLLPGASDASDRLGPQAARDNLFFIRGWGVKPGVVRRRATVLDVAPTVLGAMGWRTEGFYLGRDLQAASPTLLERYGEVGFFNRLRSAFLLDGQGFWALDPAAQP